MLLCDILEGGILKRTMSTPQRKRLPDDKRYTMHSRNLSNEMFPTPPFSAQTLSFFCFLKISTTAVEGKPGTAGDWSWSEEYQGDITFSCPLFL